LLPRARPAGAGPILFDFLHPPARPTEAGRSGQVGHWAIISGIFPGKKVRGGQPVVSQPQENQPRPTGPVTPETFHHNFGIDLNTFIFAHYFRDFSRKKMLSGQPVGTSGTSGHYFRDFSRKKMSSGQPVVSQTKEN